MNIAVNVISFIAIVSVSVCVVNVYTFSFYPYLSVSIILLCFLSCSFFACSHSAVSLASCLDFFFSLYWIYSWFNIQLDLVYCVLIIIHCSYRTIWNFFFLACNCQFVQFFLTAWQINKKQQRKKTKSLYSVYRVLPFCINKSNKL